MSPAFDLVVAMDQDRGIGKNGKLPWSLPTDLKHFKAVTTKTSRPGLQNAVIMGRKTWESIPQPFRPLPGRTNVILTRQKNLQLPNNVFQSVSLDAALQTFVDSSEIENIFVIGGGEVFREALEHPQCRKIFLTQILKSFDCDCFFPPLPKHFKEVSKSAICKENNTAFYFVEFLKS